MWFSSWFSSFSEALQLIKRHHNEICNEISPLSLGDTMKLASLRVKNYFQLFRESSVIWFVYILCENICESYYNIFFSNIVRFWLIFSNLKDVSEQRKISNIFNSKYTSQMQSHWGEHCRSWSNLFQQIFVLLFTISSRWQWALHWQSTGTGTRPWTG